MNEWICLNVVEDGDDIDRRRGETQKPASRKNEIFSTIFYKMEIYTNETVLSFAFRFYVYIYKDLIFPFFFVYLRRSFVRSVRCVRWKYWIISVFIVF